ncbi:MAG TPA: hypothetical protein VIZ28_17785 [Chitinophagaceae bacterium]
MKKSALILVLFVAFKSAWAQMPQALNYQAIARNSMGQIVPSQSIGVRFTVLDLTGTNILYQETYNTTTNNFGLFTLAIGKGTPVSGTFAGIDWAAAGDKYLRVEIAPLGGTNYTIQGISQLLSVPYALYSEKTKLIGGNAITITNGNTINANYLAGNAITINSNTISGNYQPGTAININGNIISGNYQAGPGITINGNTISATAGNSWLLNGNAGTSASNFLGTTDDQRLYFRTNNKARMFLEKSIISSGSDVALLSLSDEAGSQTNPAQLSIWGREIVGISANMLIVNNVVGQTWGTAVGNTLGRMIRFSQMTTPSIMQSHFYDLGISQDSSFYISDNWLQNGGPNIPKKMITISPQNRVGINLNNSEKPTASFHTKGSLRFEGVNTNNALSRILVMDVNGNVASRDASTIGSGSSFWVADANGIHNSNTGHVGIGGLSSNLHALTISMMENNIDGRAMVKFVSNDSWQTNLRVDNTTSDKSFNLIVGGTANTFPNYGVGPGNFGIANSTISSSVSTIPLIITSDNKVGISASNGGSDNLPKSRLHVRDGDVYIDQIGAGVIMKSPNGQCWRMTVSNAGSPVFTSIPCP